MDVDFWASRAYSPNHHLSASHPSRFNNSSDGEEDSRTYFPCPFCYVEIEVPVLCCHLQEEHCFDLRNAVCPLCAANLGKDVTGHFVTQHAQSVKRRRKSQKSGFWDNSAVFGRNLRGPGNGRSNVQESAPDPLLSPFICNIPLSELKSNQQDGYHESDSASFTSYMKSDNPHPSDDVQQEDNEEKTQRAVFFQQLIMSTIF